MREACRLKVSLPSLESGKGWNMVIKVRLFAMFREGRFDEKELEMPQGSSVAVLLEYLKIPEKGSKILLVNGLPASVKDKLSDADIVAIFPMIAGG